MKKRKLKVRNLIILIVCLLLIFVGVGCIGKHIFSNNTSKESSSVSETAEPASTPEATVEPTVDPESDTRFTSTDSLLVFANKKHKLPDGYEPGDLTMLTVDCTYEMYMREEAANAMSEMFASAQEEGIYLVATSAYRSYDTQVELYNSYVESDGQEAADTYSSRPGYSDHQTGLATDITSESMGYGLGEEFEDTAEGQWLAEHAHEYGFVMRYPKGKEDITGYTYEPWHFRYIGVEEATALYSSDPNMTMEEYYGISGGDYVD